MLNWAKDVRKDLATKPYPAKRPNQKYKRTGRLARSWSAKKEDTLSVSINNTAADRPGHYYTGYVVGDPRGAEQAGVHQNRWWIAIRVVNAHRTDLRIAMSQVLHSAWK